MVRVKGDEHKNGEIKGIILKNEATRGKVKEKIVSRLKGYVASRPTTPSPAIQIKKFDA